MPKVMGFTAYANTSPYSGTLGKSHRNLMWRALRAAGYVTDANAPTISTAGPATLADQTAGSPEVGFLFFSAASNSVARTLQASGSTSEETVIVAARTDSVHANSVTLAPNGTDTIAGSSTPLSIPCGAIIVLRLPAGTNDWQIISRSGGTPAGARAALGIGEIAAANFVDNPTGQIFCRSVNGAALTVANGGHGHDRWYALTQTGNVSISTLADVENGTPSMMRLTNPGAAQRVGYAQIIRASKAKALRGRTVALKFGRLRSSAAMTLRYALLEWTGTADTAATRNVVNNWASGTFTPGNFFISSTYNVLATGSVAAGAATLVDGTTVIAAVGNSCNNLVLFVWTDSTVATAGTLDLSKVKLEDGRVSTAFVEADESVEREKCEEFCEAMTAPGAGRVLLASGGFSTSTTSVVGMNTWFRRRKFKAPAITYNTGAGTFSLLDGAAVTNAGALGTTNISQDSYQFDIGGSGLTASRPVSMFASNGAQVVYSADLGA